MTRAIFSGSAPAIFSSMSSTSAEGATPETLPLASGWDVTKLALAAAAWRARSALAAAAFFGLLAGGLLSRRDDGHGSGLRRHVEVAAEIDGDVADVHAEQVVDLVLEHERRDEAVGDAGDGDLRRDAFDGEDLEHAVFHECILHVDAGFGIDGEQLHEAVAFSLHALRTGRAGPRPRSPGTVRV